jgi:hypothetical protein
VTFDTVPNVKKQHEVNIGEHTFLIAVYASTFVDS